MKGKERDASNGRDGGGNNCINCSDSDDGGGSVDGNIGGSNGDGNRNGSDCSNGTIGRGAGRR